MTDEWLMLCIKNEDHSKAAILYERYKTKLYHFFMFRNSHDRERSEDAVQQVFYRLLKYRHTYKEGQLFVKWMYGIARNLHNLEHRQLLKSAEAKAGLSTEEYLPVNDDHEAMKQAIGLLPAPQRDLLLMAKLLEMKYEEIAEMEGCSVGVIKVRVYRAMKSLKEVYFKIS